MSCVCVVYLCGVFICVWCVCVCVWCICVVCVWCICVCVCVYLCVVCLCVCVCVLCFCALDKGSRVVARSIVVSIDSHVSDCLQ